LTKPLRHIGVGLVLGLLLALGASRGLTTFLYGVSATDAPTPLTVSGVIVIVAGAASWLPVRRVTSGVEVAQALRQE